METPNDSLDVSDQTESDVLLDSLDPFENDDQKPSSMSSHHFGHSNRCNRKWHTDNDEIVVTSNMVEESLTPRFVKSLAPEQDWPYPLSLALPFLIKRIIFLACHC